MKKQFYTLTILLFFSISAFPQNTNQTSQIILKLKIEDDLSGKYVCNNSIIGNRKIDFITKYFHAEKVKQQSTGRKNKQHIYIIKFPEGTDIQKVINEYYSTNEIEYAEPDYIGSEGGVQGITPNDQYYTRQWSLKNDGSFSLSPAVTGADIAMEDAWSIEQGDSNIVVGIIDSGSKLDHPEFGGRIWNNNDEIPNNGIDDDANGFIDDMQGWDFVNTDNDPTDDEGHGSNVSGIIGANGNNADGYAGVDWNCKLMILKGIDNTGSGFYSWWTDAIYYAVDNGARVINMSLGGSSTSTTMQNAINYATLNNVVVVVCMMNTNSGVTYYPAGFPGVIAVGSTNANDVRTHPFFWSASSGSNYGNHISVVAPGNYIYGLDHQSNTNYNYYWGGTSQATPHVTALAALLLAQDNTRTAAQIKSIIESTAEDMVGDQTEDTPGWDQYYGYGRINAHAALSASTNITSADVQNKNFLVYPNPSSQNFTVVVPSDSRQIEIFNSLGKLIQEKNTEGQTTQHFQLSDDGIYFIQITTDKEILNSKLIVRK